MDSASYYRTFVVQHLYLTMRGNLKLSLSKEHSFTARAKP